MQGKKPFQPGSVVRLKEPYKISVEWLDDYPNIFPTWKDYDAWQGFTHGIIHEVVGRDNDGNPTRVCLFMYDPERQWIECEKETKVPPTPDFRVDELVALTL